MCVQTGFIYIVLRVCVCVCVCDVDDPLHMAWLIDVLFFDTTRLRGSTISNCVPLLMEFNEVLLHYPNSHFPTTGAAAFSTPIFVCTYIYLCMYYMYSTWVHIYTYNAHTLHIILACYATLWLCLRFRFIRPPPPPHVVRGCPSKSDRRVLCLFDYKLLLYIITYAPTFTPWSDINILWYVRGCCTTTARDFFWLT